MTRRLGYHFFQRRGQLSGDRLETLCSAAAWGLDEHQPFFLKEADSTLPVCGTLFKKGTSRLFLTMKLVEHNIFLIFSGSGGLTK